MTAAHYLAQASAGPAYTPTGLPIRIVLADDHRLMRRSLRLMLESENDVQVVGEAGDLFTAIRTVKGHMPHVLLLDVQIPGGSCIGVIRRLRAEVPDTEIVVLTTEESPVFARQALDAGAVGYVLKDNAGADLSKAIRCAVRGEEYVSRRIAARLDALRRAVGVDGLSVRETEVLRLIALGLTSGEISENLHLSKRTVESHRRRIHHKLGLGKRSELVRYAMTRNLIGDRESVE
jgi:two-component system, NarL family, response regulator NreC